MRRDSQASSSPILRHASKGSASVGGVNNARCARGARASSAAGSSVLAVGGALFDEVGLAAASDAANARRSSRRRRSVRRFVQGFEKDRTVVESLNRAGRSAVFSAGSETLHAERPRAHPDSEAQPRLYRRPRGNAPAGKVWNYHTGVWVDNIAHSEPLGDKQMEHYYETMRQALQEQTPAGVPSPVIA